MTKHCLLTLGLLAAVALVGCGERRSATATVTGKVTLPDGRPMPGGRIDFSPAAGTGTVSGTIKADGTYEALLVPAGEQKVAVVNGHLKGIGAPPAGLPPMPGADQKYVALNPKYSKAETSGLSTTVAGSAYTYDVPLR